MTHDGFRTALHGRRPIAISVLVLFGLFASACTSSTNSASSSSEVTTATLPGGTAYGAIVDINTGKITPLPPSIATSGSSYAVSPDHTKVAYNLCCEAPGPLRVANIDGTGIHQVTAPGDPLRAGAWDAYGAQWSPDGSKLVYQQRHATTRELGNLFVLDVKTGRRTKITNLDQTERWDWWFTFPNFSSDGKYVLFHLPRGDNSNPAWDLWSVPVTGGTKNLVRPNVGWGGFSPDGMWTSWLSPVDGQSFSGGELHILTCDGCRPYAEQGGASRALVRNGHLSWPRWSPDGTRISYSDGGSIYVVEVRTGSVSKVAEGGNAEWFDDHTLIVGNPTN